MATKNQKITSEILFSGAEIGGIKLHPHLVKTVGSVSFEIRTQG